MDPYRPGLRNIYPNLAASAPPFNTTTATSQYNPTAPNLTYTSTPQNLSYSPIVPNPSVPNPLYTSAPQNLSYNPTIPNLPYPSTASNSLYRPTASNPPYLSTTSNPSCFPSPYAPQYTTRTSIPIYNPNTGAPVYCQNQSSYRVNQIPVQSSAIPQNNAIHWIQWTVGQSFPSGVVRGGTDIDGTAIYVGRALYKGDLIPAKVIPDKNAVYVPWGGGEVSLRSCELLCSQNVSWVQSSNGNVPSGALQAGNTSKGESLYIGRVIHKGSQCVGKIHPSHKVCYVPFGGKEHPHSSYEVLTNQGHYF